MENRKIQEYKTDRQETERLLSTVTRQTRDREATFYSHQADKTQRGYFLQSTDRQETERLLSTVTRQTRDYFLQSSDRQET